MRRLGCLRFVAESRAGWKHDAALSPVIDGVGALADEDGVRGTQ
jgi:hypothetical protein